MAIVPRFVLFSNQLYFLHKFHYFAQIRYLIGLAPRTPDLWVPDSQLTRVISVWRIAWLRTIRCDVLSDVNGFNRDADIA